MIVVFNAGSSSLKFGLYAADASRAIATGLVDWQADPKRAELTVRRDGTTAESTQSISGYGAAVGCEHGSARLPPGRCRGRWSTHCPRRNEILAECHHRRRRDGGGRELERARAAAQSTGARIDRRGPRRLARLSTTASLDDRAVATPMGLTPLDGLMMGTRPGALDPGIILYVQRRRGLSAVEVEDVLDHASGLKGVSGISSDYRLVDDAAWKGDSRAQLALEIYATRALAAIGALAVTLGGVDALVFTAGVGEHSAALREAACVGLECLGLKLDPAKNRAGQKDSDVASDDSVGRILVLSAQEEMTISREALRILRQADARV